MLRSFDQSDVAFAAVVPLEEWQMGLGLAAGEKDMAAGSVVNVKVEVLCWQSEESPHGLVQNPKSSYL